jgi:ferredoxin-NADP reductase
VQPRRILWRLAEVIEVVAETPRTKSLLLEVPEWEGHKAGQHVDVRLTAEDGYQTQRSYSIASAPEDERLMLTVPTMMRLGGCVAFSQDTDYAGAGVVRRFDPGSVTRGTACLT